MLHYQVHNAALLWVIEGNGGGLYIVGNACQCKTLLGYIYMSFLKDIQFSDQSLTYEIDQVSGTGHFRYHRYYNFVTPYFKATLAA
jgi:hypothetical protein